MLRSLKSVVLIVVLVLSSSAESTAEDASVSVGIGGVGRVLRGQWGLVRGKFSNTSDVDREFTAVVIPSSSGGLQYGRRVVTPAGTSRFCQWPVLMPDRESPSFQFDYLVFTDPGRAEQIQRVEGEHLTRNFLVVNPESRSPARVGYQALLSSRHETEQDLAAIESLAETLRKQAGHERMSLTIDADQIDGYPEALECVEQLLITSQSLHQVPDTCDAVRVWTQRGGRTWLFLDQTGLASAQALLGDALPLTKIDETTSNHIELTINPSEGVEQYPERTITRDFDEPVRLVRVIAEAGRTVWSTDDWPVVIVLPFGHGTVVVTTVSPEVFIQLDGDLKVFASAGQIANELFRNEKYVPRITETQLGTAAAGMIGYEVPSRLFAGSVVFGFAIVLSLIGILLLRRDSAMALFWVIPLLAVLGAVPAIWMGNRSRSVAPPTAIEQHVIGGVEGQLTTAADGLVSVFQPAPSALNIRMKDFSLLTPAGADDDTNTRRMVWTDRGESEWENLTQSAGLRDYPVRSLWRQSEPARIQARLNEVGLEFEFDQSVGSDSPDMLLAGASADRMAVRRQSSGRYLVTANDILASTEFVTGTFLTDIQKRHAFVYESMFSFENQNVAFPDRLTLLYWTSRSDQAIVVGDEATHQISSNLVAQPVTLQPPDVNSEVTIPGVLLPFRVVENDDGGVSAAYSNRYRQWQQRETAGTTWLRFDVPAVCQPFQATGGILVVRMTAGSRPATIAMGSRDTPTVVEEFDSPAGLYTLDLSARHLDSIVDTGSVYLRLDVGSVTGADDELSSDRDDYWQVDRMTLTLSGVRSE